MKSKALPALLASVLIVLLIVGCTQGNQDSGGQTPSSGSSSESSSGNSGNSDNSGSSDGSGNSSGGSGSSEPDVITMFIRERWAGVSYDNFSVQYIQDKTNTKWDITAVPGSELSQKLNVLLASGAKPDILQFTTDNDELQYAQAGILLPLNEYLDQWPNLKKFGNGGIWDVMTHPDGNIYAIPIRDNMESAIGWVDTAPIYRQDWLDKLGLKVPTTIDEYYEAAVAMSNRDPDGSGRKDTYAIGARGLADWRFLDHVFGAYGALPDYWKAGDDGNLINGSVYPGTKEALRMLNKLFEAGAIDPEFITDNSQRLQDKFQQGVYGGFSYFYSVFDTNASINDDYTVFKQNNPDGEWVLGPILTGPEGPGRSAGMRELTKTGWVKTAIHKDAKNVDAIFRLLDWLTSEEGLWFVNFGIEGEHYTRDGDLVKRTMNMSELQNLGVNQTFLAYGYLPNSESQGYIDAAKFAHSIGEINPVDGLMVPEMAEYQTVLNDYTKQQFIEMIVGQSPIDPGFDNFVREWNRLGGEQLTKAMNEAYHAREALKQ